MRGNASRYPDRQQSMLDQEVAFKRWLHTARDEAILAATVDQLAIRHKIHRSSEQSRRMIETMLLARQDHIRRGA